jgi:hypothetical protein
MEIYKFILNNRELIILIYTAIISLICFIIVLKTDKLFRLSLHQGIRYFRNAFFFYGLAFILRYMLAIVDINTVIIRAVFEFFVVIAGFSLLYSLLWKKLDYSKKSFSSIFNSKMGIFYMFTIIIVFLDYLWCNYYFMFISQILLFGIASIISGSNYNRMAKKQGFFKMYFIIILLNFFAWAFNLAVASVFEWSQIGVINIYILNLIIFALFLYSVERITKK